MSPHEAFYGGLFLGVLLTFAFQAAVAANAAVVRWVQRLQDRMEARRLERSKRAEDDFQAKVDAEKWRASTKDREVERRLGL